MPNYQTLYSNAFVKVNRSEDGNFYYMPVKAKVDTEDYKVCGSGPHTVMILNETPFHWGYETVQEAQAVVDRYNEGPCMECTKARWCPNEGVWIELEFEPDTSNGFYDPERVAERRAMLAD